MWFSWQVSQFGDSLDDGVPVAERLFPQLDSQTRPIGGRHVAVDRDWNIFDEVRVEIVVQMIHALQDVEVGERGGRVDRGEPQDGSAAGMRRGGNLIGVGYIGHL